MLIVGLANPGKTYENTRHNAGAWFVEQLCAEAGASLKFQPKFHGLYGSASLGGHTIHLLVPTTFMNKSGQAIQAVMNFYKLTPADILVAHDEIDLPVGTIKLKTDGGDGGHNGLKDTIRHLNSHQFLRLRIGVGRPAPGTGDVADYVLHPPSKADRQRIDTALIEAERALPLILDGDIQAAMRQLHAPIA